MLAYPRHTPRPVERRNMDRKHLFAGKFYDLQTYSLLSEQMLGKFQGVGFVKLIKQRAVRFLAFGH